MDPVQSQFRVHGGRLASARAAFPSVRGAWLDLSTGINPRPFAGARAHYAELRRLPDPAEVRDLEEIAATAFGADPARVVAMAGAEAAIRLLPQLLRARRVAIACPTYGGHEAAWRLADAEVRADWVLGEPAGDVQAAIVVNPNNPDGRRAFPEILLDLADELAAQDGWLIVDESFVETEPELSVAGAALDNLIVLRSFGKFYGLPGVRLGFLIAPPALAERARQLIGDWPISADALVIGRQAYGDTLWSLNERQRLAADAIHLDALLAEAGLEVVGGTSLFRLARAPDAAAVFEHLAQKGVLVRPFDYAPAWLRFGLPSPADWRRLSSALKDIPR